MEAALGWVWPLNINTEIMKVFPEQGWPIWKQTFLRAELLLQRGCGGVQSPTVLPF